MANPHPETILFVGAGATQALAMPPTSEQAKFLWNMCDQEPLSPEAMEDSVTCFQGDGENVALMAFVLDGGADGNAALSAAMVGPVGPGAPDRAAAMHRCAALPPNVAGPSLHLLTNRKPFAGMAPGARGLS